MRIIQVRNTEIPIRATIAFVDDEDYWRLMLYKWRYSNGYVLHGNGVTMQSLVIKDSKPSPKHEIDHINGNKLDNRKRNLRWATRSQNVLNWHRNRKKKRGKNIILWPAQLRAIQELAAKEPISTLEIIPLPLRIQVTVSTIDGPWSKWDVDHDGNIREIYDSNKSN